MGKESLGDNDIAALATAIRGGDRSALARAITVVESTRADHRRQAQQLLMELMQGTDSVGVAGPAMHVGITGVPGVGKSTTIEALGMYLIEQGHRVAVLAVDPSSTRTGGSILGDKTRMARLAVHPDAYIRPSPTSGTLGGVTKATRETIVLLEAAGFDVIDLGLAPTPLVYFSLFKYDVDGAVAITGTTMPSGGTGLTGWLSLQKKTSMSYIDIAYNACYGGFGLSQEARAMYLAQCPDAEDAPALARHLAAWQAAQ
jgi:hypothetical protein